MKKLAFSAILVALCCLALAAQSTPPKPVPYGEDEFPEWLEELRRFEIISIGAFPIAYFFTAFGFDAWTFFFSEDPAKRFNPYYAPWPFGSSGGSALTGAEVWQRVVVAAGISVVIGIIDWIILELSED